MDRGLSLTPTYLSLFAGIGGLDLAVEAMGFECVAVVHQQAILALTHLPEGAP